MEKKSKKSKKNITNKNRKSQSKTRVKKGNHDANINKKNAKMKLKYKHPKLAKALKIILIILVILMVIGVGIGVGLIYGICGEDFSIDMSELIMKENSIIVDTDGNILAELNGDESRKIITLEEMSPYLPKAYISIEDERFDKHHGVDIKRTGAAVVSFVTHGGKSTTGGGSTITQQVVKNVTQEKASSGIAGAIRKLKEWAKAYQIENVMSKDQIIELYLNLIYVGNGGSEKHGVEIGAEYYFNKTAKDLSIAQCAFLAGINHSPNSYNPYSGNDVTEKISKRTKTVLSQMKKFDYITQEEYDTAIAEVEVGFQFENGVKGNIYSSHTDALISQLISQIMEEKQISKDAAETYLQTSGLTIYSTQVSSVQNVMEEESKKSKYELKLKENGKVVTDENGSPILAQGAAVVIEPSSGNVVGAVGQLREKTTSRGLNRINSKRQTGSAIKPLADVLPGIEEGIITPATIYADLKTTFGKDYSPDNYNNFTGLRTVRTAVTTSQNIPFVKIMAELTPQKSIEYLEKMGVTSLVHATENEKYNDENLALAIGGLTYGISPLEMAGAYACIANDGTYIEPTFYTKVEDSNGKIVLEPNQKTEKVCSAETAYIVKNIMQSVITGADGYAGTASYCAIKGMDVAVKTGTTNDSKDRWLCGFTNYYVCATWFGFDDPKRINFSGTNPAGQIFSGIMSEIHKGLEDSTFNIPEKIVHAKICRTSGRLADNKCSNTYDEIFIEGHLPEACEAHQSQYTICKETGYLANEFCPSKEIKSSNYVVEKERLGLWTTNGIATTMGIAPTEYCTIHKKTVEIVKPTNTETTTEQPNNSNNTETEKPNEEETNNNTNTTQPETKPEEPVKPEEPTQPEQPSTDNSGENNSTNNTTEPKENNE